MDRELDRDLDLDRDPTGTLGLPRTAPLMPRSLIPTKSSPRTSR